MKFAKHDAVEMKRDAYGIPEGTPGKVVAVIRGRGRLAAKVTSAPNLIVEFERGAIVAMTVRETDLRASA